MSVFNSFEIRATGLTADRMRMDVAANNIANAETTRTPEGGPYRRQMVVFEPRGGEQAPFQLPAAIRQLMGDDTNADTAQAGGQSGAGQGVHVVAVVADPSPGHMVYEPGHPDANAQGYVAMPNVNTVEEMANMISAQRSYEANVTAMNAAKAMAQKSLEIGR